MGGKENVKVVCRVRPLNDKEKKKGEKATVKCVNQQQIQIEGKPKKYNFDAVCGPESTQEEVYDAGAKKVVDDILKGFNGTIFAYGQTSSGKTFTMEGELKDKEMKGIIPRIIEDIYEHSKEEKKVSLNVKVAYFEIYNEVIRDLLDKSKTNLPIHEDKFRSPYVKNLTEENCNSSKEINVLINKGKKNRHTAGTNMNERSSRSHSVFQMVVVQDDKENHKKTTGRLYLVDLAGSEKVSKSGAEGERLTEAKNINKSLSCLGNVISALTENNRAHVPYRDSKLTRILQQSLGGNARTTVIICVSPAQYNEGETISTLQFGVRAKTIKNVVKANVEVSAAEWRNRFVKVNKHMDKVKELVLKLCKETKQWRDKKEPKKKEQIDIDQLIKLVEKGMDFDTKGGGKKGKDGDDDDDGDEDNDADGDEGDPNELRDKERLKDRLSRTSIATSKAKGSKAKKKKSSKKSKDGSRISEGDESNADTSDTGDESGAAGEVPEDVLAVLKEEVELKTKQLKEEKAKLNKLVDEKDEDMGNLEKAKNELEEKMKENEKLLKEAQGDSSKAKSAIEAANQQIEQYKERNRRLEEGHKGAEEQVQQAKEAVKQKDEEVQQAKQQVEEAKKEIDGAKEEAQQKQAEAEELKQKVGAQLGRLVEDIQDVGRIVSNDPESKEFEVEADLNNPDETLNAVRVLLTKVKHYGEHGRRPSKEEQEDKGEREQEHVENKIMLNQAKEKISQLESELKSAHEEMKELQEKINERSARIAQMAKEGGYGEDGLTNMELDPDLQMLHDEHAKQIRDLTQKLEEEKAKNGETNDEKDQWQVMAEKTKADNERLKSSVGMGEEGMRGSQGEPGADGEPPEPGAEGEPLEPGAEGEPGIDGKPGESGSEGEPGVDGEPMEPGEAAGSDGPPEGSDGAPGEDGEMGEPGEAGPEALQDEDAANDHLEPGDDVPSSPGLQEGSSEAELQNLSQIKKNMDAALAKNKERIESAPQSEESGSSAESGVDAKPKSEPGGRPSTKSQKEQGGGSMTTKQVAFLEATLDSVTKNNRALAAENRTLKVQRLPALQNMVKSLQAKCQEWEKMYNEEKRKNERAGS